jgi:hypothetical protein
MGREKRANAARREAIGKVADELAGHFVDRGRVIEIGFASMIEATYPDWKNMPKQQMKELRMAFFGGAQHLFGSIMGILDPGSEPTERDLKRMDLISHELEAFIDEWKQVHGITDPDIGNAPQTKQ